MLSCRGFGEFTIRFVSLTVLCLVALLVSACGKSSKAAESATPKPTRKAATPVPTTYVQTYLPTATPFPTPTAALTDVPTDEPTVEPTHARPTITPLQPGRVLSAVLQPLNVEPGARIDATVQTSGSVGRIDVYLGSGAPGSSGPISIALTQGTAGTWSGSLTAPSQSGLYHYTVGLYVAGRRTIVDNNNWNVKVLPSSTAANPLPDNIPLAPPFNWGNPISTTFQANGQTISGSEVVSNTRTDVTESYVAQWYANRLPAAGWTVEPSTIPAKGATSFTMVATSGAQVCVVQYAAGTIHIFYG